MSDAGGFQPIEPSVRDGRSASWIDALRHDLRDAVRTIVRAPLLSLAVAGAMTLGIGATTTTMSAVDAVLIRPLPYAHADRLVVILGRGTDPVSAANLVDWRRATTTFASMGAAEYWSPDLRGLDLPERILGLHVTPEILTMLGVSPALGRLPAADASGAREVVLSDGLWRRRFGADPQIVGRVVTLDADPQVIVGVMPASFHFAPFWATRAELWGGLDLSSRTGDRDGQSLRVFATLAPGASLEAARAEMAMVTASLESLHPGTNRDITVTPLKDKVVGDVRLTLLVLFGAVLCVLLIACGNVAHLLLARASTREREFAIRGALGAGRLRAVRQLLTESVLLALGGGIGGCLFAVAGVDVFRRLGANAVPRLSTMTVDGRVLVFAAALSIVTGLVFGLAPAIALARVDVTRRLRDGERGATSGRAARRTRETLMGSEVAVALVLLAGAGLLLRSFTALRAIDPGFVPEGVASFVVSVAGSAESAPGRREDFYDTLLDRLRRTPGVLSAAAINHMPLVGDLWGLPFQIEGRPAPAAATVPSATYRVVTPGYFETMRIPMRMGRDFTREDRANDEPVIIVSHDLAVTYWPGQSAIGKRIRVPAGASGTWRTVVGVSSDTVRGDIQDRPAAELFLPFAESDAYRNAMDTHHEAMTFVIRAASDPAALLASARTSVRAIASDVALSDPIVMTDAIRQTTDGARFTAILTGTFAGVALLLSALGVYGVMSYGVAARRREMAIRLALGATRRRVAMDILARGLAVAGVGLLAGLGGALAMRSVLVGLLFGVRPLDPITFACVVGALTLVTIAACLVPAGRAGRINPIQELR